MAAINRGAKRAFQSLVIELSATELRGSTGVEESFPPLSVDPCCGVPAPAPIPPADSAARFHVEVDPWLFRAHVGIRLQWLGSRD